MPTVTSGRRDQSRRNRRHHAIQVCCPRAEGNESIHIGSAVFQRVELSGTFVARHNPSRTVALRHQLEQTFRPVPR